MPKYDLSLQSRFSVVLRAFLRIVDALLDHVLRGARPSRAVVLGAGRQVAKKLVKESNFNNYKLKNILRCSLPASNCDTGTVCLQCESLCVCRAGASELQQQITSNSLCLILIGPYVPNFLGHMLHWKGFSPVCVRSWICFF